MRYPDSDGEYNNWFFLDFFHTILRYFWVGLDLFCPSACFRRSRGYDEVAPRCRQRLRSSDWDLPPHRNPNLLSHPPQLSTTCQSLAFSTIIPRLCLGDLGFGLAGGRCWVLRSLYRGRRGRLPENGLSPSHTVTLARRSPVFLFELVCTDFPGVTSLCEQRNISHFLWGFCSRESVGWNPFAGCQSSARRRGEKMVKWGFVRFFHSFTSPSMLIWSEWQNVSDKSRVWGAAPKSPQVWAAEDLVAVVQAGLDRGEVDQVDQHAEAAHRGHVRSWQRQQLAILPSAWQQQDLAEVQQEPHRLGFYGGKKTREERSLEENDGVSLVVLTWGLSLSLPLFSIDNWRKHLPRCADDNRQKVFHLPPLEEHIVAGDDLFWIATEFFPGPNQKNIGFLPDQGKNENLSKNSLV